MIKIRGIRLVSSCMKLQEYLNWLIESVLWNKSLFVRLPWGVLIALDYFMDYFRVDTHKHLPT